MNKRKASGSTRCARISLSLDRDRSNREKRARERGWSERDARRKSSQTNFAILRERRERRLCESIVSFSPALCVKSSSQMFILLPRCAGTSERSWPWSVRRRSRRRCSKLNNEKMMRDDKERKRQYVRAREENLWLRWKQNSETKIRPLETHRRAHTHTHTNAF